MDADKIAHSTYAPGGPAYDGVVAAFGKEVSRPMARSIAASSGRSCLEMRSRLNKLTRSSGPRPSTHPPN